MGPIGWQEMILILVVLLLLFGAKRLPEMGRSLGRGMREFKDAVTGNEPPEPAERAEISEPKPAATSERVTSSERAAEPESEQVRSS